MCHLDDSEAVFHIECRLQAQPDKYARVMEGPKCSDTIPGQGRTALPLARKAIVHAGQRGGQGVTVRTKKSKVAECPGPALGQSAHTEPVVLQNFDGLTRESRIAGVIRVRGEAKHHLLGDARLLVLPRISDEMVDIVFARKRARVELWASYPEHAGDVAVRALMFASTIGVGGQRCVFLGLARWRVDIGITFDCRG